MKQKLKDATLKLCKPALLSIFALSSAAATADVCPSKTGLKLEKVSLQGGDSAKGDFVMCSYISQDGKKVNISKGTGSKPVKATVIPSEITPVTGSAWNSNTSGKALVCDPSINKCEFNPNQANQAWDIPGDIDIIDALMKLSTLNTELANFKVAFEEAARPYQDGVRLNIDLPRNAIKIILTNFGKMPDGTVNNSGKFFTFGIGAEGEAEAKAMAQNMKWDPATSVIKNADGTYSVVIDTAQISSILSDLNLAEQEQINNRYLDLKKFIELKRVIYLNEMYFKAKSDVAIKLLLEQRNKS